MKKKGFICVNDLDKCTCVKKKHSVSASGSNELLGVGTQGARALTIFLGEALECLTDEGKREAKRLKAYRKYMSKEYPYPY